MGLMLAASILAQKRVEASEQAGLPPVRLSMLSIGRMFNSLSLVLHAGVVIISEQQCLGLTQSVLKFMAKGAVIPPRKARSCQRGVHCAISPWPVVRSRPKFDSALSGTLVAHF